MTWDNNALPDIINAAGAKIDFVLDDPDGLDCAQVGFGDSAPDFAVEYRGTCIDDGGNKYKSQVLLAIWNVFKDNSIETPYPHRTVKLTGEMRPRPA
jgi:small-conductance mechanosensitive channel